MQETERLIRIGVDARLVARRRGIGNYIKHLLDAMHELHMDIQLFLYVDDDSAIAQLPVSDTIVIKVLRPKVYPIWEQFSLPLQAWRDGLDVLHCPANAAPLWLPHKIRLVLTIHDVMYMLPASSLPKSPSLYQRFGRDYLKWIVPRVARRASAIVTVSAYSRDDIIKHVQVDAGKLKVIWEAPGPEFRKMTGEEIAKGVERFRLPKRFAISLGAVDPRKNTARIIQALGEVDAGRSDGCGLVLVGMNAPARASFERLARQHGVADRVLFLDFVSDFELAALYNAADALLYPSLYEGFGVPLLEAMACGTAIITSPSGAIPEVAGDAAMMVDPLDVASISQGLRTLLLDSAQRERLVKLGLVRITIFSWEKAALSTLEVYQDICGIKIPEKTPVHAQ